MQLFYQPDLSQQEFALSKEESGHVVKVLRMGVGDVLHFTDGKGTLVKAEIIDANPKSCRVRNLEHSHFEPSTPQLTIACAPTKSNDRFEFFLEKATEIGVARIIPLLCERSERKVVKQDRLNKVLISAMKQSQQYHLPQLDELTPMQELVQAPFEGDKFIAHCSGESIPLLQDTIKPGNDALILIGPEGDFSEEEVGLALRNAFGPVSLGSTRLRTETAAIVSCTIFKVKNR